LPINSKGFDVIVDSKAIGEETAYLKEALECSPFGIIVCNRWLRVMMLNGAACRITGLEKGTAVGNRLTKLFGSSVVGEFLKSARGSKDKDYLDLFSSIEVEDGVLNLRVVAYSIRDEKGVFIDEINNPLCSILGNTQLLLMDKDKLDPVVVEKLEMIERDISRIHDIAEKLARITKPVISEYVGGTRMIDVEKSSI